MPTSIAQIRARVASQKELLPALYGQVDFDRMPERWTDDASVALVKDRSPMGITPTRRDMDLVRAYTMLGDIVADAYAALIPKYGPGRLIQMLQAACDQGVDKVPGAPPELGAFIRDMERIPDWVDMDLVREGARLDLNPTANVSPFAIRGAFIATFLNKYSALPMALTGTLSHETAAHRVRETAHFFACTVLPGALERHGAGFKAVAMVRLMHSMVRVNVLTSGKWDSTVYGVPIPQVDQMPAGLIPVFLLAFRMLDEGRREFTPGERAQVELARYRCFLLGLPEDLLSDTPEGIVRMMTARNTTLRDSFDDETCGSLVRATMAAYLPQDESWPSLIHDQLERRFSKLVFVQHFLRGDREIAAKIGIDIRPDDYVVGSVIGAGIALQVKAFQVAESIPVVRDFATAFLTWRVEQLISAYGHAKFTTDAAKYRPTAAAA
ncbi:MAG: oxygenase MpaB family protein [Alphaproteobacteria bacterium]